MEQIAEAADVAQATFFNYFAGKRAVLGEMTGEVFDFLGALVEKQLKGRASTRRRLTRFADLAAQEIERAQGLARDVLLELVRTTARPGEVVPYMERVHEHLTSVLREGQQRGDVRCDLEAGYLAEMVVGMFNTSITNWMADPHYPIEKRLRQTAAFIAEAIAPRCEHAGEDCFEPSSR